MNMKLNKLFYCMPMKYSFSSLPNLQKMQNNIAKSLVIKKICNYKFLKNLKLKFKDNQDFFDLISKYEKLKHLNVDPQKISLFEDKLLESYLNFPNISDNRAPIGDENQSILIDTFGEKIDFPFRPKSVIELGEKHKCLQIRNIARGTGSRSYYLLREFADLETALVNYTIDILLEKSFNILSVPNILQTSDIESCGFKTTGHRSQVYKLSPNIGLSGTGEMSIAAYLRGKLFDLSSLPLRFATVSRCFRAETSDIERERGLYRVHNFTKVEMFGITSDESGNESDNLLQEFLEIQKQIYSNLNFHVRVLDMATGELGSSASRKFDMEAWLPSKQFWGEISSASNCTDYQTIRLDIRYLVDSETKFCHTINGTACAIPRILIAMIENNQQKDGSIIIPPILHPYLDFKIIKT